MSNLAQMESKSLAHPSDDKNIDGIQKNLSNISMTEVSILNDGQAGKEDYEDNRHERAIETENFHIESTEVQPREENTSLESDVFQDKTEFEDGVLLNENSSLTDDGQVSQEKYEDDENSSDGHSLGVETDNMNIGYTEVRPRAENTPLEGDSFQSQLSDSMSMEDHSSVPVTEVAMDSSGARQVKSTNLTLRSDQRTVHIDQMYGDVILSPRTLKKDKVTDPDLVAYDPHIVGGNCLLNAVCLDVDVIDKVSEVCLEFKLPKPEPMLECERYNYLYNSLATYLEAERLTRYNFLRRLNDVTDVSHLCRR